MSKWQSQDSNPGSLETESVFLNAALHCTAHQDSKGLWERSADRPGPSFRQLAHQVRVLGPRRKPCLGEMEVQDERGKLISQVEFTTTQGPLHGLSLSAGTSELDSMTAEGRARTSRFQFTEIYINSL